MSDREKSFVTRAISLTFLALSAVTPAAAETFADQRDARQMMGQCVLHDNVIYNAAAFTPADVEVADMSYSFSPRPASLFKIKVDAHTRYFRLPAGIYTVTERNARTAAAESYVVNLPECSGVSGNGLTWRLVSQNATNGVVRVGCGSSSGSNECNPYSGDTSCTTALPLLCIKKSGSGFPLPKPASVNATSFNNRWSGGIIGTTGAVQPPATLSEANGLCEDEFGEDWRVAEFHDGAAWYFQAIGYPGLPSSRFWVHINDQPANCWTNL